MVGNGGVCEPSATFAGGPDGFERLWTPHRLVYVDGENKPADGSAGECPFCIAQKRADDEGLVVYRGKTAFVVMNLYPYNTGHVLICPRRHVPEFTDLEKEERDEFGELTATAMKIIGRSMNPDGFNLGMNQGEVAGAGITAHLHQHVIPRWLGDSNFFPLVARTKAIPELLEDTRARLAQIWAEWDANAR